jgi:UDP-4-amino-4,6-dideoxy-N-acetyl-beta-L-altrosamine transaminase
MIPYGRQSINKSDVDSVISVLKSDYLTQGEVLPRFERAVARYCGANYSVAVNSATSALHIACLALGLGRGDWLWTSPITFVASSNCGLYCGANIDFVDIDLQSYNLCPKELKNKLQVAKRKGVLPKVLVVVHFSGQPCKMEEVHKLSLQFGFKIIEDASHAIGARYKNFPVGNCKYSDVTVFSFHPVKIITTGEGGMSLTNNVELFNKMKLFRSHGITRDTSQMIGNSDGDWYYQQIQLGFNYRMTEIQAALGLSQMDRLDDFILKRHDIAQRYDKMMLDFPLITPKQDVNSFSSFHLYIIRLDLSKIKKTRKQVFNYLRESGIGVNVHYVPVHLQPYYKSMGFRRGDFPKAESYYMNSISLPLFPDLKESEQDKIIKVLERVLNE